MKLFFIAVLSLWLPTAAWSWTLPRTPFTVTSDLGPRNIADVNTSYSYDFHSAIDYHATVGTPLLAVANGTITLIRYNNTQIDAGNYLVISVSLSGDMAHSVRYLHLSASYGTTWEIRQGGGGIPIPTNEGIIIFRNGQGAITQVLHSNSVTPEQKTTIAAILGIPVGLLSSSVSEGNEVVYSGDTGVGPAHGHIDFDATSSLTNPLFHLPYFTGNNLAPVGLFLDGSQSDRSERVAFPSNAILYRFGADGIRGRRDRLRVAVNSSGNGEDDLNRVNIFLNTELEYSQNNNSLVDTNGDHRIRQWDFGGRDNEAEINAREDAGQDGFSTGVSPQDSNLSTGNPDPGLDDFIFNWNSRLRIGSASEEAGVPTAAQWKDGRYRLISRACDIRNVCETPDVNVSFVLDNFRPLLERAEITKIGYGTKYLHMWNPDGSTLSKVGPAPNEALGAGAYTINFRFSEPVVGVKVYLDSAIEANLLSLETSDPAGNQKNFTAALSEEKIASLQDGIHSAIITAKDLGNNELLSLPAAKTTINSSEITRDNSSGLFPENAGPEIVDFTIDRRPPSVYLPGNTDGLYGEQTKQITVSTGELTIRINDDPESLCAGIEGVCEAVSGIKSVLVTNTVGVKIAPPRIFNPPEIEQRVSFDLPGGDYILEAVDAADNKTSIPIKASGFRLRVDPEASQITAINRDSGVFSGTLHVKAQSASGLTALMFVDKQLGVKYLKPMSGETSLTEDIPFEGSIEDYYLKRNMVRVGVSDMSGRIVWQPINFSFENQTGYRQYPYQPQAEISDDTATLAIDLVNMPLPMLPGAIMSVYAPTAEDMLTKPRWWWESRNGWYHESFYPPARDLSESSIVYANFPMDYTRRENIGRVKIITKTWDESGKSNLPDYTTADREMFHISYFYNASLYSEPLTYGTQLGYEPPGGGGVWYVEHASTNITIPIKRYVQTFVSIERVLPTSLVYCDSRFRPKPEPGYEPNYCLGTYVYTPVVVNTPGPNIYGFSFKMLPIRDSFGTMLSSGSNVSVQLPDGGTGEFGAHTVFTPGILRFGYASVKNYPGYNNLSGNLALRLETRAAFDHARLTLPYNAEGLALSQESGIKIYKITNAGEYIALGTTVDAVSKKVQSADMDSFGRIMVAAPRYINPKTTTSSAYAGDKPEMEFTAEAVSVEQSLFDAGTPGGIALLSSVAENGLLLSNIYKLGLADLALETPGTFKMHFDTSAWEAVGIKSVSIYRANSDGAGLYKLSGAILDPVNHEIAVDVWQPAGLYMLVGSTSSKVSDNTPPIVGISYGEPKYTQADKLYVSTLTLVSLSGADSGSPGNLSSGMGTVYYLIDADPILEDDLQYSGAFNLDEGIRILYYSASDLAGNKSMVSSGTVYVDGSPPGVSLWANANSIVNGGRGYITIPLKNPLF